jgi:magnesium transporter
MGRHGGTHVPPRTTGRPMLTRRPAVRYNLGMSETERKRSAWGNALQTTLNGANNLSRSLVGLHNRAFRRRDVGAPAGIEPQDLPKLAPEQKELAAVTVFDYSPDRVQFEEITDLDDFIIQHRPEWSRVRWVNVDGLNDPDVIRAFAEKYDLHPLAIEDVLHTPQRPKIETYPSHGDIHGRVFIIARMLTMLDGKGREFNEAPDTASHSTHGSREIRLQGEQISIFLGRTTLITFQEMRNGDVFDPIRTRIRTKGSRLRENDASFLMYTLLDAIVDHCFPILEHYSDRLEELEDEVLSKPDKHVIQRIHATKRELLLLRRAVWPMREVINSLAREHHECLSAITQTYLRDVYDHSVQIIDMVETYREFATGLTETYMSSLSNRMNEIMKVLAIVTTIFTPMTFLAGVYGMNFDYLPGKEWHFSYEVFWFVCIVMGVGMLILFRWRKWL